MISAANVALNDDAPMPELTLADRLKEDVTAWDSVMRSVFRLPPYNPDAVLVKNGADIYEKMMTDPQVRAAINTKRFALLARPWQVFPAECSTETDRKAAEGAHGFVLEALRSLKGPDGSNRDFRNTLFEMMSAFYRGYSLAELIWTVCQEGEWRGKYRYAAIKFKNPKQIGFDLDPYLNLRAVTSWTPTEGYQRIPREKCLLYVYNQRDELPYGESDLKAVYRNWYCKRRIVEFWNIRLQRFGVPFAYANVGTGNDVMSQKVGSMLKEMQQDSSAVFPSNVKPELLETHTDGGDAFLSALEWHNQQIATGILLQTLSSSEGKRSGSLALGKVHFNILLYALECMKQDIESAVNSQIIRPLIDFNFDMDQRLYPRFSLGNVDEDDIAKLAEVMDVLLRHGVADSKEPVIREMFNLPPIKEGTI